MDDGSARHASRLPDTPHRVGSKKASTTTASAPRTRTRPSSPGSAPARCNGPRRSPPPPAAAATRGGPVAWPPSINQSVTGLTDRVTVLLDRSCLVVELTCKHHRRAGRCTARARIIIYARSSEKVCFPRQLAEMNSGRKTV